MPTGFTAGIDEGKIKSFADFAKICARAFGALIELRDDPLNKPLPTAIRPDTKYYEDCLAEIDADEAAWKNMSEEERQKAYRAAALDNATYYWNKRDEFKRLTKEYDYLRERVLEWIPPTADHQGIKDFMLEQLKIGAPVDYSQYETPFPKYEEWVQNKEEGFVKGRKRYQDYIQEEIKRADERNNWLQALLGSLNQSTTTVIGEFETSGTLMVTDPCYTIGTWCQSEIDVRPGRYEASVTRREEDQWGVRNTEILIHHVDIPYDRSKEIRIEGADIGVDSGQAGFFDKANYPNVTELDEDWYDKVSSLTLDTDLSAGVFLEGAVSSSGYGDGGYALFVVKYGEEIVGARIEFIGDETDEEQVFDSEVQDEIEGDPKE